MKKFFNFLLSFFLGFSQSRENRRRDKEINKIKLPTLTQQDPLITDEAGVKITVSRIKEFMFQLQGPIGSCGIIRETNGNCMMHIIISETLTPEQEENFRKIVGNTAIQMHRGVSYFQG
jgi:hypothetical protein